MKKIFTFLITGAVIILLLSATDGTGTGWSRERKKVTFADSVYFNVAPTYKSGQSVDGSSVYPELADTIPIVTFGLGSAQTGDTAVFVDNALAGAFYNEGSDTLVITQLMGVLASGTGTETVAVQVSWNDTLQAVVPTNLNASALAITSMTVGTSDVSFANSKIPPNKWVWCKISGVSAGNRPSFLNITLSGYKIPKY